MTDVRIKDHVTNSYVHIDYDHHEVHEGSAFSIFNYSQSLGDGSYICSCFRTPALILFLHLVFFASASGLAEYFLLENPVVTVDSGVSFVVRNQNREDSDFSQVSTVETVPVVGSVSNNATITGDGTVLDAGLVGGTSPRQGATFRGAVEWVLRPDATYAFRLTSRSAANLVGYKLSWYEHAMEV